MLIRLSRCLLAMCLTHVSGFVWPKGGRSFVLLGGIHSLLVGEGRPAGNGDTVYSAKFVAAHTHIDATFHDCAEPMLHGLAFRRSARRSTLRHRLTNRALLHPTAIEELRNASSSVVGLAAQLQVTTEQ